MKYIKKFDTLSAQTEYLAEADIDTYLGYVDENDTVYYDDALPPYDYSKDYLTIEALTAGNLSVANAGSNVFNYSLDNGSTWNVLSTLAVNDGEKVLLKSEATPNEISGIGTINYSGNFNVYGNAMSLVHGDNFIEQEAMVDYQFCTLFSGNTTLTSAENLILPNLNLGFACYWSMFAHCTSLTTAPELSATTLTEYCYEQMFQGCTSLTKAPELPATMLVTNCYSHMFEGCTSLTKAPELPATTLTGGCYQFMFSGCTSLNYIKCLATDISANNCTIYWISGVASTGTFVKNAAMTSWTTGNNGIPNGWTVVDA